jgi:hypothetical protein
VDEILKFLEKIEIIIRNWLQNQGSRKEEGVKKRVEKKEE